MYIISPGAGGGESMSSMALSCTDRSYYLKGSKKRKPARRDSSSRGLQSRTLEEEGIGEVIKTKAADHVSCEAGWCAVDTIFDPSKE